MKGTFVATFVRMAQTIIRVLLVMVIALAGAQVTIAWQTAPRPDDRAELQKIQEDSRRVEEQLELLKRYIRPEFDRAEEEKSRLPLPALLTELGTADLELVGLADLTESWRAYVYGPARRLTRLEAGAELFDATVKSVGPEGVTFSMKDGKVITVALRR